MAEGNHATDRAYGVFEIEDEETVGRAVMVGVFTGSLWAVVAFLVWAIATTVAQGPDESTRYTLSVIAAMLTGGIFQQLWFNYRVSSKLDYRARVLGFGLTYLVALSACAWLGQWLPVASPWAWMSFLITYLVILALLTLFFSRLYSRHSLSYQQALEEYRSRRKA